MSLSARWVTLQYVQIRGERTLKSILFRTTVAPGKVDALSRATRSFAPTCHTIRRGFGARPRDAAWGAIDLPARRKLKFSHFPLDFFPPPKLHPTARCVSAVWYNPPNSSDSTSFRLMQRRRATREGTDVFETLPCGSIAPQWLMPTWKPHSLTLSCFFFFSFPLASILTDSFSFCPSAQLPPMRVARKSYWSPQTKFSTIPITLHKLRLLKLWYFRSTT